MTDPHEPDRPYGGPDQPAYESQDQPDPELPDPGPAYSQAPRNGMGIAALVLGILGLLAGLFPLLFIFAGLFGLLAVVFGLIGRGRVKRGFATNGAMSLIGASLGLVAMFMALIGVIVVVSIWNKNAKAFDDVTISACTVDDAGEMIAALKVRNSTDHPADYDITVAFNNGKGTQLASGGVSINALKAGQTGSATVNSQTQPQSDSFGCEVVEASRSRS
jgi:hypothetical protein